MQLKLDLTERATRDAVLDALLDAMDDAARARFDAVMDGAVVPDHHHHTVGEVYETVDALDVPAHVKDDLRAVYGLLADAEAQVHGCPVDQTHFHEVGDASGIRNALAICVAFDALAPDSVTATAIQPGSGEVECAHGILSIPAPATAALLEGLPLCEDRLPGERCTPTSAALIRHFVTSFEA